MRILVIGTGHVGRCAVEALTGEHEVVSASRSTDPGVDVTDTASIENLFDAVGPLDAVVCAAGSVPFRPLAELTADDVARAVAGKVLPQFEIARIAADRLADGGSITLTTGVLARRAVRTGAVASLANGAVEAFVLGAALELPRGIRINAVSPGVLEDAPEYHATFAGFDTVTSAAVGEAFRDAVEGDATGTVFAVD